MVWWRSLERTSRRGSFGLALFVSLAICQVPSSHGDCKDEIKDCEFWASSGECKHNPRYMAYNCKCACSRVQREQEATRTEQQRPKPVTEALRKAAQSEGEPLEIALGPGGQMKYRPLHPELFGEPRREWFAESFLAAIDDGTPEALRGILTNECEGVYSFDLLKSDFARLLMEEKAHYAKSGLPVRAPNSMNNYGLVINHIGMTPMMDAFQQTYLFPLTAELFGHQGGDTIDHHHSFLVQYKKGEDLGLDVHHDDSDITLNVCLGKNWTGAGLTICGLYGTKAHRQHSQTYTHVPGRAILHSGNHRHGADDIEEGERVNLIVWNRSHRWRKNPASQVRPTDGGIAPHVSCLSYTHDHDYCQYKPRDSKHYSKYCSESGENLFRAEQQRRRAQQKGGGS